MDQITSELWQSSQPSRLDVSYLPELRKGWFSAYLEPQQIVTHGLAMRLKG